ncbi:hypothetical protein E4T56_gene504 [Termitomyces sp. T112]|nr:hypothetical protein E4T56_gene504 [Termitomyces sp. T112]
MVFLNISQINSSTWWVKQKCLPLHISFSFRTTPSLPLHPPESPLVFNPVTVARPRSASTHITQKIETGLNAYQGCLCPRQQNGVSPETEEDSQTLTLKENTIPTPFTHHHTCITTPGRAHNANNAHVPSTDLVIRSRTGFSKPKLC